MVARYPHTVVITYKEDGTYTDGDYTAGATVTKTISGRAEPDGKGSLVTLNDGSQIAYTWKFYCQALAYRMPYDAMVVLTANNETWTGTLKGQSNNQINTILWL
jgi:hypothetical protein